MCGIGWLVGTVNDNRPASGLSDEILTSFELHHRVCELDLRDLPGLAADDAPYRMPVSREAPEVSRQRVGRRLHHWNAIREPPMNTLLIIDDDPTVALLVDKALEGMPVKVQTAKTAGQGLAVVREKKPDVLLLDVALPDASGLELIGQILALDPGVAIAFVTVSDDSDTAIEAMKRGAYDYLVKPLSVDRVQRVVSRALETRRHAASGGELVEASTAIARPQDDTVFLGRSPAMLEVYKEIGRIATRDVPVLICGESGTGKELVAHSIHQHSSRSSEMFLAVNCAALTETLLESELFGHEKGSFTGADRRQIGKFERADGGTIFLDEVGDMSPATQSKVLRLLQEQQFERVGGRETIVTDVRILSATNRDLRSMIKDGAFREDLYHRLNGYRIDLPPLRERGEDIVMLTGYLLARFGRELGKEVQGIAPEAMEILTGYSWPGNVRELQTVLRTALLKATGPVLTPENLPETVQPTAAASRCEEEDFTPRNLALFVDQREKAGSHELYAETLEMVERYLIMRVLRETKGNQSKAAERLGITRGSLRNKIHALRITVGPSVQLMS